MEHLVSARKQKKNRLLVNLAALALLFYTLSPFLTPILLAAVMAFAVHPLIYRMRALRGLDRKRYPTILFSCILLIIGLALTLIVFFLYAKIYELATIELNHMDVSTYVMGMKKNAIIHMNVFLKKHQVSIDSTEYLDNGITNAIQRLTTILSSVFYSIPKALMSCFVFAFFLYLFLHSSRVIKYKLLNSHLLPRSDVKHYIHILQTSSYSAVFASIFLGFIHSLIISLGALFLGFHEISLLFVVAFLLSFIPVMGASSTALALAVFSYFSVGTGVAFGYMSIAFFSTMVDNLLRPFIVRDHESSAVNPILMLIVLFSSLDIFGFAGLFIAPVIANFAMVEFRHRILEEPLVKAVKPTSHLHHAETH